MHGNKDLSRLSVTFVCKQWNVMYDGNSLQIHFISKNDSNCVDEQSYCEQIRTF